MAPYWMSRSGSLPLAERDRRQAACSSIFGDDRQLKTGATTTGTLLPFRSSDAVRCAEAIIDRAGRDIALAIPIGVGKPVALVNALYRLAEADRSLRLRIFTGLSLVRPPYRTSLEQRFVEPLLDRLFGNYPDLDYANAMRWGCLPHNVEA